MAKKKDPVIMMDTYLEFPGQPGPIANMHRQKIVKALEDAGVPVDAAGFINYYVTCNGLPKIKGIGPEYSKAIDAAAKKIARKFKVKLTKEPAKKAKK